ncbi:hypothetical protein [Bosea sp. (in: a-proteobacteria)]|uniref:hypothetical protein n=1 Tax=Bosea sp. (in: a-proteobacteria) TaxID=1871050 RepID=UPI002733B60C|nr:hypothetical protein [Bosea sp. (in: a-proteobacteria)]MDP3408104.1 hypothetical protein [Bosea sp. (in: a-proteobacteria)]
MSRYIDRLTACARQQFRDTTWCTGDVDPLTDAALEDALIQLAKKLPGMRDYDRVDLMVRSFGESEILETTALVEAIQADLDLDAEVAGDPAPEDAPNARFRFYCVEVSNATPAQVDQIARMVAGILSDRG